MASTTLATPVPIEATADNIEVANDADAEEWWGRPYRPYPYGYPYPYSFWRRGVSVIFPLLQSY